MDEKLKALLNEVKRRVDVLEGENPVMDIDDAIRVAERAGVLYRWAKNGENYELRQSADHPVYVVPHWELPITLCGEILRLIEPREPTPLPPVEETPKKVVKRQKRA